MITKKLSLKSLAIASLGFALTISSYAGAADSKSAIQLKDVQGKVMVNTGSGYVAGNNGMILKPGYKVMLSDKAQAKILYANNCAQTLKQNSLIKVGSVSECNSNMFDEKSNVRTAALGDVSVQQSTNPGMPTSVMAFVGGLVGVVGTTANSNNSNQTPNASAF